MLLFRLTFLVAITVIIHMPAYAGDDFEFLWQGTYALSRHVDPVANRHLVVAYLPPTTLIFSDNTKTRTIAGREYRPVITQHGQKLLVDSSVIANRRFRSVFGKQDLIFHQNSYMCNEDNKDCNQGIDITRGDVVQHTIENDHVRIVKTIALLDKQVTGYLTKDKFNGYLKRGVASDASRRYPRYRQESTKRIDKLSTSCGQKRRTIDVDSLSRELNESITPTGLIPFLSDFFSISASRTSASSEERVVELEYGSRDIALEVLAITIREPENESFPGETRVFNVTASIKCLMPAREKIFVESLSIREGRKFLGQLSFNAIHGNTLTENFDEQSVPFKIFRSNGSKYFLTSINHPEYYKNALDHWVNQLEDASLSQVLMSVFNYSCPQKANEGDDLREKCAEQLKALPPLR